MAERAGRSKHVDDRPARAAHELRLLDRAAEAGFPAVDVVGIWGFIAPAGVPPEVMARLHALLIAPVNAQGVFTEEAGTLVAGQRYSTAYEVITKRLEDTCLGMGFTVSEGPLVENVFTSVPNRPYLPVVTYWAIGGISRLTGVAPEWAGLKRTLRWARAWAP